MEKTQGESKKNEASIIYMLSQQSMTSSKLFSYSALILYREVNNGPCQASKLGCFQLKLTFSVIPLFLSLFSDGIYGCFTFSRERCLFSIVWLSSRCAEEKYGIYKERQKSFLRCWYEKKNRLTSPYFLYL